MKYQVTKETYEAVMKRDNERCVLCYSKVYLQLHHIDGRSRTKTNDLNNCVMLCYLCHTRVHQNQKRYKPYLKDYIERVKNETN